VVVNDLDDGPAKETIALIEKLGSRAVACNGDVTARDFGDRIVDTAVKQLGGLHVIYIQTRLTKPLAEGEAGTIEVAGRTVKVGVQGARIAAMNKMIPLGRGGFPEEAAGAVYLFCSPDSDFVSGRTLVVTGGA
jgi:NAD(P)-dependent dehydrogenase (short-subunit alcohol dehydrogenase family)